MVFFEQDFFELSVIDYISVVGHDYSKRRINKKGLGIFSSYTADCWVAGVADADVAF